VTLNCCLGGVSVDNAPSLARKLVERGFPAAVGMREVLSNQDAPVFSRQLYGGLLEELDERLATGNRRFELNWSKLLRQPRRLLHQARAGGPPPAGPERRKEWTLPILYVAPSPFRLRRPSSNDALRWNAKRHKQSELTTYLDKIAKLTRLETPDAALEEIRGLALTVEAELYPDA
jgi:hypothetical protein